MSIGALVVWVLFRYLVHETASVSDFLGDTVSQQASCSSGFDKASPWSVDADIMLRCVGWDWALQSHARVSVTVILRREKLSSVHLLKSRILACIYS